jgi:hypothetical protein
LSFGTASNQLRFKSADSYGVLQLFIRPVSTSPWSELYQDILALLRLGQTVAARIYAGLLANPHKHVQTPFYASFKVAHANATSNPIHPLAAIALPQSKLQVLYAALARAIAFDD